MNKLWVSVMVSMTLPMSGVTPHTEIGPYCLIARPPIHMMAQEGNPGHTEPPEGWHCAQGPKVDKDHTCTCHRACKDSEKLDENGEGTGEKETRVVEDVKCKSFCFQNHCTCPLHDCD